MADIIDNLTTNESGKPLSAAQGVALKALIDAITVPTKVSELINDSGYLTAHQSLADYAKKSELFSKDYNDLTNKPTIPSIDGLASEEWVEEKGYLTAHQDLSTYAKKTEIPTKVSQLTNDSGYLTEHQNLAAYAKSADLATVATSGSYNDLTNKPTIPSTTGLATETYVDEKVAAANPIVLTGTLTVAGWAAETNGFKQTVTISGLATNGYVYTVYPNGAQYKTWTAAGIYAEDITIANSITIHCTEKPVVAISINIKKE